MRTAHAAVILDFDREFASVIEKRKDIGNTSVQPRWTGSARYIQKDQGSFSFEFRADLANCFDLRISTTSVEEVGDS